MSVSCPALFISASASHQGKTTVTAALARYHAQQGRRVRVFKNGPDFLDPTILAQASGAPVYALDVWMNGAEDCRQRVFQAAQEADIILIEGSMGLFDGTPSSADLAALLGVPVLVVMNTRGMAQTFAALAQGLANYRPDVPFYGVLANQVASARHAQMLQEGLPEGLRCWAYLPKQAPLRLPERHLGLVAAQEIDDLAQRLDQAAQAIAQTELRHLPPAVTFTAAEPVNLRPSLAGVQIAIARDAAFSFIYPANIDLLTQLGAQLSYFSPLADEALPVCDAVYLPGGYPELHLSTLSQTPRLKLALQQHIAADKPVYAECGGMLYLLEGLNNTPMLGLLPGQAQLQTKLVGLGLQAVNLHGEVLRGHTFHYTQLSTPLTPLTHATRASGSGQGEAFYQHGSISASYFHAYFPSNPQAAARLFLPRG